MDDATKTDLMTALRSLIQEVAPDARLVPKYGGEVIALDPNSDTSFVGGIFGYKDHVTMEFSEGTSMHDPEGHLEGKGKARRHLKFQTVADITAKNTASYLTQAIAD